MSVNEQLRERVRAHDGTLYAIARESKLAWASLKKFVDGGSLRAEQFDRLCEFFQLELQPKAETKPVKAKR